MVRTLGAKGQISFLIGSIEPFTNTILSRFYKEDHHTRYNRTHETETLLKPANILQTFLGMVVIQANTENAGQ